MAPGDGHNAHKVPLMEDSNSGPVLLVNVMGTCHHPSGPFLSGQATGQHMSHRGKMPEGAKGKGQEKLWFGTVFSAGPGPKRCPQSFSLGSGHGCHGCPRSPGFRRPQAGALREECPPVSSRGHEMPHRLLNASGCLGSRTLSSPLNPNTDAKGSEARAN